MSDIITILVIVLTLGILCSLVLLYRTIIMAEKLIGYLINMNKISNKELFEHPPKQTIVFKTTDKFPRQILIIPLKGFYLMDIEEIRKVSRNENE